MSWAELEPQQGQWRWEKLDRYVAMAEEHHVLITTVHHAGENPERFASSETPAHAYENSFTCIPAGVAFRPPLQPKPTAV